MRNFIIALGERQRSSSRGSAIIEIGARTIAPADLCLRAALEGFAASVKAHVYQRQCAECRESSDLENVKLIESRDEEREKIVCESGKELLRTV